MDQPGFVPIAIGSFIAGWLSRDWATAKPEVAPCKCLCTCNSGGGVSEGPSIGNWLIIAVFILGAVLVCSNGALAFRFTYRDSESGKRHEFSVGVKGKKGVFGIYGVPKGLQITEG